MKLILFSMPNSATIDKVEKHLFPESLENKRLAYINPDGSLMPEKVKKYMKDWEVMCERNNSEFIFIEIDKDLDSERKKNTVMQLNLNYWREWL
ncbi:MAG: hypothetical protein Q9M91_00500 [Candidatus Dojkabacteria bacterium]|nr:hypothetical protein [Candidatus Dojkabacteria bacterium]